MNEITTNLPDELLAELNRVAAELGRSRAQLVRDAVAVYLEGVEDLRLALECSRDSADRALDWEEVRRELVDSEDRESR